LIKMYEETYAKFVPLPRSYEEAGDVGFFL
jgi:hypothetical protein